MIAIQHASRVVLQHKEHFVANLRTMYHSEHFTFTLHFEGVWINLFSLITVLEEIVTYALWKLSLMVKTLTLSVNTHIDIDIRLKG